MEAEVCTWTSTHYCKYRTCYQASVGMLPTARFTWYEADSSAWRENHCSKVCLLVVIFLHCDTRNFAHRALILSYMNLHHPEEVLAHKSQWLKRSIYWTAGVNDIWVFDQHDKWRRFQLFLHVAIEPFSGHILWLKIWWTNRNPRLICGWYCNTVQALSGKHTSNMSLCINCR